MRTVLWIGGGVLLGFLLIFTGIAFFPGSYAFNLAASIILILSLIILFVWLVLKFLRPSKNDSDER